MLFQRGVTFGCPFEEGACEIGGHIEGTAGDSGRNSRGQDRVRHLLVPERQLGSMGAATTITLRSRHSCKAPRELVVGHDRVHALSGDEKSNALRSHLLWSKTPTTCSQASANSRLMRTSSGFRSIKAPVETDASAPKKPLPILVERRTEFAKSPTSDIAACRRTPPGRMTLTPGASASTSAMRRPFVTTTSSCFSRNSLGDVERGRARVEAIASPSPTSAAAARATARFGSSLTRRPNVERDLRLAALKSACTASDARDQTSASSSREVAPDRHLGDAEGRGELTDRHTVARLQQLAQYRMRSSAVENSVSPEASLPTRSPRRRNEESNLRLFSFHVNNSFEKKVPKAANSRIQAAIGLHAGVDFESSLCFKAPVSDRRAEQGQPRGFDGG